MKNISALFRNNCLTAIAYIVIIGSLSFIYISKLINQVDLISKLNINNERILTLKTRLLQASISEGNYAELKTLISDAQKDLQGYLREEKSMAKSALKNEEIILLERILLSINKMEKYLINQQSFISRISTIDVQMKTIIGELQKLGSIHSDILKGQIAIAGNMQKVALIIFLTALLSGIIILLFLSVRIYKDIVYPLRNISEDINKIENGNSDRLTDDIPVKEIKELAETINNYITRKKKTEEYIVLLNKHLEKEVEKKTMQLQNTVDELKMLQTNMVLLERLATVGELSASFAHEIRKPLNSLSLNLQFLNKNLHCIEEKELAEMIALLHNEVHRIDNILLELTNAAMPRNYIKEDIDIGEIVANVTFLLDIEAKKKHLDFSVSHQHYKTIKGNKERFQQVFINLMLNAIQAAPEHGTVAMEITEQNDTLIIAISDDGKGVPDEILPLLFKPFVTTKANGTGLGLAISKRIIEDHHGSISYTKQPYNKTTFIISLPYR